MSAPLDSLTKYKSRRDFRRTPEPSGQSKDAPKLKKDRNPIFVIQQHDATTLHFDFRIEVDGVLKSWAVPKGPSTDPTEKRLAIATEDHPLQYADFEGVIPKDQYGAGTVLVWDAGPYKNISKDEEGDEIPIRKALKRGTAEIWLEGKKLRGGYALVHSKMQGKKENWLLVKMKDEGADARRNPVRTEPKSVLSGRTLQELRKDAGDGG